MLDNGKIREMKLVYSCFNLKLRFETSFAILPTSWKASRVMTTQVRKVKKQRTITTKKNANQVLGGVRVLFSEISEIKRIENVVF